MDLTSKWLIALYGWAGYNLIVWYVEKQKSDKTNTGFDWSRYLFTHYDDWIITLFFAYPVVKFGPDIHSFILSIINVFIPGEVIMPWYDIFYAGPGPLVQLLYFLATKLWPAIKKKTLRVVAGGVPESTTKSDQSSDIT